jgi:hypothetical protein
MVVEMRLSQRLAYPMRIRPVVILLLPRWRFNVEGLPKQGFSVRNQ